jgi:hypothetical protein
LVVRADWKIIRNACILWYGFLFLAFAGFKSEEHFGWVLIFAMFFSIPVVPVVSLVLKHWKLLRKTAAPATPSSAARPFWARFTLVRMSPTKWTATGLLLVGGILFVSWQDRQDIKTRTNVLRQFFALPADIQFTDVNRISKSAAINPRIEAIAQFTAPQWDAYLKQTEQTVPWPLINALLEGKPLDLAAVENLKWQEQPLPELVGNHSPGPNCRCRNGSVTASCSTMGCFVQPGLRQPICACSAWPFRTPVPGMIPRLNLCTSPEAVQN